MDIYASTRNFRFYSTRAMHCLITHDDADRPVFLFGLHLHLLSEIADDKCYMSLKFSCYAFTIIIGISLSQDWASF